MAILLDAERKLVWAEFMKDISVRQEEISLSKIDLRDAINAIDQWADDNASSYNTAIPLPARTSLTSQQKAALLMYVVKKRWEEL